MFFEFSNRTHKTIVPSNWYKSWVNHLLNDNDRALFSKRVSQWLTRKRRGKLKFPLHFPEEIRAVTGISRSELVKRIFNPINCSITDEVPPFLKRKVLEVLPHNVCIENQCIVSHERNVLFANKLALQDWPRLGQGRAWPCTPTFGELLQMIQKGKKISSFEKFRPVPGYLTIGSVKQNITIARRIVVSQIIGIRSSVDVPREFLKFFRYRWNFLILTKRWNLPSGLVRFLLSTWKTKPYSLWLQNKMFLKDFLKSVTVSSSMRRGKTYPFCPQ